MSALNRAAVVLREGRKEEKSSTKVQIPISLAS